MRNRICFVAGSILAALIGAALIAVPAQAQVVLGNFPAPASAVEGSQVVLSGCYFPAGIQAVDTLVTFTPAPGAGPAVTATANADTVKLGSCYDINVTVPVTLVPGLTTVSVANAATSAPVFSSTNAPTLNVTAIPIGITLGATSPAAAPPGTVISLPASGFTSSAPIPAANVMVTIQPATGPPVSVPASLDPLSGGTMQVSFLLPQGVAAGNAAVTLSSAADSSPPFYSLNSAALDVQPSTVAGVPLGPITPATVAAGLAVSMKANGMPAGFIPASNILVTVTPPPGNGAPITVPARLYLSFIKTISFPISTGFTNNAPILCSVSITNKPGTFPAFSLTGATVTITPPPTVNQVSPGAAQAGTSVPITLNGDFTHFGTTSTLSFTPFGQSTGVSTITASNIVVNSTTSLSATLNIAADATPGAYTVNVTTGTEVAHSGAALVVTTSPGLAFNSIAPNGGALGQTLTGVAISASQTHFVQGGTIVDFGPGIQVTGLQVVDPTDLLANLVISPTTTLGARTVSAVTGGEFAVGLNAFTVDASPAALVAPLTPDSGAQGTNIVGLQINGSSTHFLAGATHVAFSGGINAGQVTVLSPTSLTVDVSIPPGATVGPQNVTVTTGGEVVSLTGAFTVTPATPFISSVTPNSGQQGQNNLDVVIAGAYTNFQPGSVTVSFGSQGISVNSTTVDPVAQTVTVNISIAQDAVVGGRTATLVSSTTSPTDFQFGFGVTPSPAAITSICVYPSADPNCVNATPQNSAPKLTVTGNATHWVQGTTHVTASTGVNVGVITVTSPTTAEVDDTVAPDAPVGSATLTFATGGEVVSGTFNILASQPTLTMSPTQGMPGDSVPVTFTGSFTHWCDNAQFACAAGFTPTTAVIDGAGVTVQNFTIISPASASATLLIAPSAPLGTRTVTLTTGLEVVSTRFSVTDSPATLLSMTPSHSGPSGTVDVEIVGSHTHFTAGITTLGLGPDIAVSNLVVNSPTDLTATLTLDGQAALGWRSVFVNTIDPVNNLDEELTTGFSIVSPVAPVFAGISPSVGYQGQVLTVTMTGVNTNWQPGVTQALVGAEITVNSLTINSPTSATAVITVSPYAPLTSNPIVMITGSQVDSGPGLRVDAGPAQVLGLCRHDPASGTDPAANTCAAGPVLVGVGQTITVAVTGQATHWLQGGTVAKFGSGSGQIYTDSLTILDQTHALAQLTVLSTATPGFQPVTFTTLGEVSTIAQGMDLVNSSPEILSTTPNAGQQGATLNVQVLGQFTHWCDNVNVTCDSGYTPTVPSFGPGVATFNSITVQDSETAVLNLTVNPLAYPTGSPCPALTMTTGTEQVVLNNGLCVLRGPATLTSVSPNKGPQGQTTTVSITGLLTHFIAGQTTADFGTAVQAGNVNVIDATHATVDVAVTANAPVGYVNATLTTLGETASLSQAFSVVPGTPTLNQVSVLQGEQGQSFTAVQILGQYTHWCDNVNVTCAPGYTPTTITFGQGITVTNLQVLTASEATVDLAIDPLAFTGGRNVVVTTGTETVSKSSLFQIVRGPAIISQVTPGSANQGQEVVLQLTGLNTHWQQGLTQFSISGGGYDIAIHSVLITSPTTAQADVTFAPTAGLGARSVYMVTAGEALTDNSAVVVTGGIPAIASVSPNRAQVGSANVNVTITGLFTDWLQGGVSNVDFGTAQGSGINLISYTVNSDTSITAVVNVSPSAPVQLNKVTVTGQTKNQNGVLGVEALTGYFSTYSTTPPVPYIEWMTPGSAIPGQTLNVHIYGAYTHWDLTSQITFGAGIEVVPGTFSVTSPTSAVVTIAVDPNATGGTRTVILDTGSEEETSSFGVVIAQPTLSIVDPHTGLQGAVGLNVNVIGSYTNFDNSTTFQFGGPGSGITVTNTQILGPTVALLTLNIDQLAPLGGSSVTATTTTANGPQVVTGAGFNVSPSLATIQSVTPNTGYQGNGFGNGSAVTVTVAGEFTHWDGTTSFVFGDGITVSNLVVDAAHQTATMDLSIPPLAALGGTYVTATTGGEIATLNNAFVVQAGTPIILSASTGSGSAVVEQQQTVPVVILGQVTQWDSSTTVTFGPGFIVSTPVSGNLNCNGSVNPGQVGSPLVTAPTAMTVCVTADPLTYIGAYTLTVTTPDQANQFLTLPNSLRVLRGPAAITGLNPATGQQAQTLDVAITGTNTNFVAGASAASFGPGISVNQFTVTGPTTATANITIAANATPALNSVSVTTAGELATAPSAFSVQAATPVLQYISPAQAVQGTTETVTVSAVFTHFTNTTQFDFGPGVTVNSVVANSALSADVNITVSPIAPVGPVTVSAISGTEVATASNLFSITAGTAAVASVTPASGRQNQSGLQVVIAGAGTHFTAATPSLNLGSGITVTQLQVVSDTALAATLNISASAATGARNVTVTTGGETAVLAGGFTVQTGTPVITAVSPNQIHQGSTVNLTVTGLFSHFDSGISSASFSPNDVTFVSVAPGAGANQAVITVSVSDTAQLSVHSITVTDPTDGAVSGAGVFTVTPGLPAVASLAPNTGAQGSTTAVVVTGNTFTHFSPSSVVSFSGGVTAGAVQYSSPTQLTVPVSVANGTTQGLYTVTVTTGSEVASLANAFQVLPGVAAIQSVASNVGVPNSAQTVTLTGAFTNFAAGQTTANFGPYIGVGGAAAGVFGPVTVINATHATADLTIAAGAPLGAYTVTVNDPTDGDLTVTNGFTLQAASPVPPVIVAATPPANATNVPTNAKLTLEMSEPVQNADTSNVILFDQSIGGYSCTNPASQVPGQVTTDASGRVVTFSPDANLKVGTAYLLCVNGSLNHWGAPWGSTIIQSQGASPQNLAYGYYSFTTGFGPSTSGPRFTAANIQDGDTAVGTNAVVTLGFSAPIIPASVTAASFYVEQAGSLVPGAISYNSSFTQFTFTPATALAPATPYTVTYAAAITDWTGAPLANPGSFSFTTAAGANTSAPSFVSWTPCCSEVTGLNPTLSFTLNRPVNPLSVTPGTFIVRNQDTSWTVPNTGVHVSNANRTVTLTLPGLLDPATNYFWSVSGYDRDGNHFSGSDYFQTAPVAATTADTTPPSVVQETPAAGDANVPLNPVFQLQMDKPLDWNSVAGATVTLSPPPAGLGSDCFVAGNLVANCGFETGNTSGWTQSGNSGETVTTSAAFDSAHSLQWGNWAPAAILSQSVSDTAGASYTFSFYLKSPGTGSNMSFQALWNGNVLLDLGPSLSTAFGWTRYSFTVTGTGADTISFQAYNQPNYFYLDDVGVGPAGATVADAVLSHGVLAGDHQTVSFGNALLDPATTYTATLTGLKDLDGNAMAPFQWSFQTGVSSTVLSSPDNVSITPPDGATGVDTHASVVFTLSNPVALNTVSNTSLPVFDYTSGNGYALAGAYAVTNGDQTVTFTPSAPFAGNHRICARVSASLLDAAGNAFNTPQACFTTAAGNDTTPPTIVSITPDDGATGIGPNNPVTVIFSKPMNPGSFNNANIGLFVGTTLVSQSVSVSHDMTAATFNFGLNYGTTYTVVVTPNVTDLAGNHLSTQVSSSFTTMPRPATSSPTEVVTLGCNLCVTGFRPGAGATGVNPANPLTFFISSPLDPGTLSVGSATSAGTMYVAQDGILIDGSATLTANDQVIVFTPAGGAFTSGAQVEAYLTNAIADPFGNPLAAYSASFTVAAATANAAPRLVAATPTGGGIGVNPVVDARFDQPLDPATVTASNAYVLANNNVGTVVAGTLALLNQGNLLRFTPAAPLAQNTCYYVYLTGGLANLTGQAYAGSSTQYSFNFCTGLSALDTSKPDVVIAAEPADGSTNVGVNALLRLTFAQGIDPLTVDADTLALSAGGAAIPYTFSYTSGDGNVGFGIDGPNQLVLTPQAPLPTNAQITLSVTTGITDPAGMPLVPKTIVFTTAAGPDFTAPHVAAASVSDGESNVPVGSVFTLTFSEAMDTRSFQYGNTLKLRDTQYATGQPNNLVPAIMTFTPDGRQVTIAPFEPLAANRTYNLWTCNTYDLTGNRASCWSINFTTALNPESPLAVVNVIPPAGAAQVETNINPEIQFNHPVSEPSAAANISLSQNGTPVPASVHFAQADTLVTLAPGAVLQPNTQYQLTITGGAAGVVDAAAGARQPSVVATIHTGDASAGVPLAAGAADTAWTVTGPNLPAAAPVVLSPGSRYSSWQADDNNSQWIGVNDSFTQPAAPYTFTTTFNLSDPSSAVLNLQWGIDDTGYLALNGTPIATGNGVYSLQSLTIAASSGLFVNGVNTLSVTMTGSDAALDGMRVVGTVDELAPLAPPAGTYLPATITVPFTTGASFDADTPGIAAITPGDGMATGTNPVLRVQFAEPMDPTRASGWSLYDLEAGTYVSLTPAWSPDLTAVSFTYAGYTNGQGASGQLDPGSTYRFCTGNYVDFSGNGAGNHCVTFTTGTGAVSVAPTVTAMTPPAGATGVPLNPVIALRMSAPLDPTSVLAATAQLSPATPGTLHLSGDGLTLSFTPAATLAANTAYTLSWAPAAFSDVNGNPVGAFSAGFTTAAQTLSGNGSISLTSPAPGSNGVAVDATLTLALNRPVDPLSVVPTAFMVCLYGNCNQPLAGAIAIGAGGTSLTFTPLAPLPASTHLGVYAGWSSPLYDLAGNPFNDLYGAGFTTGPNPTPPVPQVIAVTPTDQSTGLGPNTVVSLAFNEALNQSTINQSNFNLYNGYTNLNANVGYSSDRHIVTLDAGTLPFGATITVVAGTGVEDVAGTPMAAPFTSTFAVIPHPYTGAPNVVQFRPGNGSSGIDLTRPITLYTSRPVNPATVTGSSVVVLANGVAVAGSLAAGAAPATSDGQTIVFTPAQPYPASAIMQVFLTSAVTDDQGNAFSAFSGAFTTRAPASDPAVTGPRVVGITPGNGCGCVANPAVVVKFDQPIDPATVNAGNFFLVIVGGGTPVTASVSQIAPDLLELVPAAALSPNANYGVYLTAGIQNLYGLSLINGSATSAVSHFYTGLPADTITPAVSAVAPTNGATNVGNNVLLFFAFNAPVITSTVNPQSVALTADGQPVPFTLGYNNNYGTGNTGVTLTPLAPLPDNAAVSLKISLGGTILDVAGNPVPERDVAFTTGPAPDFALPVLVSQSPDPNRQATIQTNATFTLIYNEPLSPNSVLNNPGFTVYDYGTNQYIAPNAGLSADGTTITLAPGLDPGVHYSLCVPAVADLAGNQSSSRCFSMYTASGVSGVPQLLYTTPGNGASGVPTNGVIDAGFDETVDGQSLGQIVLTPMAPAGPPVPLHASLIYDGSVVRVTPAALLAPNTVYQLSLSGVTDLSGANAMLSQTISFTTGPDPQIGNTSFNNAQVVVAGVTTALTSFANPGVLNVDGAQPITLNFSGPVEQASLLHNDGVRLVTVIGGVAVPFTVTLSNGGATATITPVSPLAPGTQYELWVNWVGPVYDQAGYHVTNDAYFYFTTQ